MSKVKIDQAKRTAASHAMMFMFHAQTNISTAMGNVLLREFSAGLTEKERVIIARWRTRANEQADLYRSMAWHLRGQKRNMTRR